MSPLKKSEELATEIITETENNPPEDVQVDARFRGKTEAVKSALRSYAETLPEDLEAAQKSFDDLDEKITTLLADPKCFIIIERTEPVKYRGVHTGGEVDRMKCPLSIQDIRERITENHGGKKYRISIHPATPTGEMKTLTAFPLEIAGEDIPLLLEDETNPQIPGRRGFRFQEQEDPWADSLDPTAVESADPAVILTNHYRSQAKLAGEKMRMKSLQKSVQELEGESGEENSSSEVRDLRSQMEIADRDRRLDERFSSLEGKLSNTGSNDMTVALLKMMENSNQVQAQMRMEMMQQQNSLLTTFMEMNKKTGPEEGFDSQLDRMVKMKSAMEGKGNGKIEEIMFDLLSDKLMGKPSEEDPVSVAVKEGIEALKPVLMELVKKKPALLNTPAVPLSQEEARAAYEGAGRKAAQEIADRLRKQQENMALQNASNRQLDPPSVAPSHLVDPNSPAPSPILKNPAPSPSLSPDYLDDIPPGPHEEGYNRNDGVNFVLSAILQEIDSGDWKSEKGSYVIGDFLDRLDTGLLHSLSLISTGEELDILIRPYAHADLLRRVKDHGSANRAISAWLEQVLVTVKNEVIRGEQQAKSTSTPGGYPTHVAPPVIPSVADPTPAIVPIPTVLNPTPHNIVDPVVQDRDGLVEKNLLDDEENPVRSL